MLCVVANLLLVRTYNKKTFSNTLYEELLNVLHNIGFNYRQAIYLYTNVENITFLSFYFHIKVSYVIIAIDTSSLWRRG